MSSQIKHKLVKNFYDAFQCNKRNESFNDFAGRFSLLRNSPSGVTWKINTSSECSPQLNSDLLKNSQKELLEKKIIKNINFNADHHNVLVDLDVKHFIKDVLESDPTKIICKSSPKKVIIEFSSPNIAKPFHVGHLRSTIIGNSLANIKKKFGNNIIKMNFLGDWGTQFGKIQLGMILGKYSEEDLQKNPLRILFEAYVKGNAEAEKSKELYEQAKKIFCDLELEKEEITQLWAKYRNWSLDELNAVYERLGVSFDEYAWESDCNKRKANNVLRMLEEKGILFDDEKGRKVAVIGEKKIPLLKSDETTLYLLRDLVSATERRAKYSFDEMYYVVDNAQSEHFHSLFTLCSELKVNENAKIEHIKFGRVLGMSSRMGTVVFLSDVLNEAQERIYNRQLSSKNTKVSLENKEVADILGVSAVIINDLQHKRNRDYKFCWESITNIKGGTGLWLQYCHSRLCNLETESGQMAASECDPEALLEPEALDLVLAIARYEESLHDFSSKLEPCVLVKYLFYLVKAVNVAYKTLNVKHTDSHLSSQRLLMFNKSKTVLNEGMRLLGLKPLNKM